MKTIALEDDEIIVLSQILKGDHARLILEIAHTDSREYRKFLKDRENLLSSVMGKLDVN